MCSRSGSNIVAQRIAPISASAAKSSLGQSPEISFACADARSRRKSCSENSSTINSDDSASRAAAPVGSPETESDTICKSETQTADAPDPPTPQQKTFSSPPAAPQ